MKNLGQFLLVPIMMLALSSPAFAHAQGGGNKACLTTYLPTGVWSLVAYDNAGQPCAISGDATCSNAPWDWPVQGHLILTNVTGYRLAIVHVQLWAGNHGGSCYGGTANPIVCDNPSTHWLQEDYTKESELPGTDFEGPFTFLFYELQPFFNPGDANYSGFWIFVKPIGRPAICKSQNYFDDPDIFTHN